MLLSVIGCGYLGAVHAAAMASIGHDLAGINVNAGKVATLSRGEAPFFEPGLQEILAEGIASGRLRFSTDMSAATGATLTWNPEFLREGWAVHDTVDPDRLVAGVPAGPDGEHSAKILREVYHTAVTKGTPFLVTDYATSELVNVAANAFLTTKVSFINTMVEIAETTGANVTQLADAIGHDVRIGRRFLGAGIAFGGGCLPKDIRAFAARAKELGHGESVTFLREVDAINLRRRERAVQLLVDGLGGAVFGKKVAVLGASFKPYSDDIRDSPALDVAVRLHRLGAEVVITDPKAIEGARVASAADLRDQAGRGAGRRPRRAARHRMGRVPLRAHPGARRLARADRIVVDGRNCLDPAVWRAVGWTYYGMGRP